MLDAVDRFVGELVAMQPDGPVVVFSMHGMGPNHSDLPSMVLLPELLHRWALGRPLLQTPPAWSTTNGAALSPGETWSSTMAQAYPHHRPGRLGRYRPVRTRRAPSRLPLTWMPAAWYRHRWPDMAAFAIPSFYDGRIRVNLAGREHRGKVPRARYDEVLDELEALVRACRDPATGTSVVAEFERVADGHPERLGPNQVDAIIRWEGTAQAFDHPDLAPIGPVPYRRSGGHSGRHGVAWIAAPGIGPADGGAASSFDVVPTLVDLLGLDPLDGLSGSSLLRRQETLA